MRFILEHEPRFEDCERRWILNRIVDAEEREAIIELLERSGEQYTQIVFDEGEFCRVSFDVDSYPYPGYLSSAEFERLGPEQTQRAYTAAYRMKNNYVMNNNGARNHALEDGHARAKWVLPFDGNCFLTAEAWGDIRQTVTEHPHVPYFIVPMQRITDNSTLLDGSIAGDPTAEPQIIFRFDATERFNEAHPYGRRPKVELLRRLEVPGPWQYWRDDPWDQPTRPPAPEAGQFRAAGRVMRLASGVSHLEVSGTEGLRGRGFARQEAICETINHLTETHCGRPEELGLTSFRYESLEALRAAWDADVASPARAALDDILHRAEAALERGAGAVVDKTELPPSKNPHDYYHPAPYWWPNPKSRDGMPYVKRDGERVPGTGLYDEESARYDRTRLQHLFDDGIALALAWFATGERRYAEHGAAWLRRWFLDEETRMNPHLRYAQVRWGHEGNRGQSSGIIEMKDLYYYLDAVRLFEAAGALSASELERFRAWLGEYLEWLTDSDQGRGERTASNNHGTYYDLQVAAIAAFLEDRTTLYRTLIRARDRMGAQYAPEGVPVPEMRRTQTAHYCCYNLQGWLNLAVLARRYGDDLLHHEPHEGGGLQAAVDWLGAHYGWPWPYKQIEPFNADRFVPLFALAGTLGLEVPQAVAGDIPAVAERTSCFHPHDGIRPYWALDVGALEAAR